MPRIWLTLEEAGQQLDVTERTVREWIKAGFLSSSRRAGSRKTWLKAEEVEQFRQDRETSRNGAVITREEFLRLKTKLRRLESEMQVVLRILDAKDDPLRMTPEYARELFEVCLAQKKVGAWSLTEITPWLEVFLRIDESDFEVMAGAVAISKPWKPFLQLCTSMTAFVVNRPEYETSLELQGLHRQLVEGRRRLRVAALIYSEMFSGLDADIQTYVLGDSPKSLRDSLTMALLKKP